MTDTFSRNVWLSVGLHVALAALILVRAITLPSENIQVRDAIRVEVVDLPAKSAEVKIPDKPVAPKAAPTPPPPAPAEPVPPPPPKAVVTPPKPAVPKFVPKPKKETAKAQAHLQSEAMNKLKALERMDQFKKDIARENAPAPIRGNQVSAGNALSGIERLDYDKYFDQIRTQVFSHWSLPTWMADANFKAVITVVIDEHGAVVKKIVRQSSGNDIFDNRALESIDASSPFPEPPARLRGVLSTSGLNFNFPQ